MAREEALERAEFLGIRCLAATELDSALEIGREEPKVGARPECSLVQYTRFFRFRMILLRGNAWD